jgi:hypothetical protein
MSPYEVQGHPAGADLPRAERGPRSSPRRRRMTWRGRLAVGGALLAMGIRLLADAAPALWPAVAARVRSGTCAGGRLHFAVSPLAAALRGGSELQLSFDYLGLLAFLLAVAALAVAWRAWRVERRPLMAFSAAGLSVAIVFWGVPWLAIPLGLGLLVYGMLAWTARR